MEANQRLFNDAQVLVKTIARFCETRPQRQFAKTLAEPALAALCESNEVKLQTLYAAKFDATLAYLQIVYTRHLKHKRQPGFNSVFFLHEQLKKTWRIISRHPEQWQTYLMTRDRNSVLDMIVSSAMVLDDSSSFLCLAMVAAALEQGLVNQTIIKSQELVEKYKTAFDLTKVFFYKE